jgi:cell division septum initiation protein DivIVA
MTLWSATRKFNRSMSALERGAEACASSQPRPLMAKSRHFSLCRFMSAFGGKANIPAYAASLQKAQRDAAAIIEEAKAQAERILASAEGRASRLTEPPRKQKKKIA